MIETSALPQLASDSPRKIKQSTVFFFSQAILSSSLLSRAVYLSIHRLFPQFFIYYSRTLPYMCSLLLSWFDDWIFDQTEKKKKIDRNMNIGVSPSQFKVEIYDTVLASSRWHAAVFTCHVRPVLLASLPCASRNNNVIGKCLFRVSPLWVLQKRVIYRFLTNDH